MSKVAYVFPGQGTQHAGMGSSLFAEFPLVREVFEHASSILGIDMRRLCLEGSPEELNMTINTQIAVLTLNIAIYSIFKQKTAIVPVVMAGHSLGEYSALFAAGALGFTDVFELVQIRARLHQEAVAPGAGAMAAIIGLDDKEVELLCAEAGDNAGKASVAIHNAPQQVVVSGHTVTVEKVENLARQKGALKVVRLPISAPCHCSLLQKAAEDFSEKLAQVEFKEPVTPVIPNCNPEVFFGKENARELLFKQIVSPVKWRQTIEKMSSMGVDTIIELGPKRTLCGLIKRIDRKIHLFCIEDSVSLQKTVEMFSA
jgi:[acyl-carrier-protein] S-malonyltransferase